MFTTVYRTTDRAVKHKCGIMQSIGKVRDLGRLTIILDDELEKRLRGYIARNYAEETYGKISQVINEALRRFLDIYMQ